MMEGYGLLWWPAFAFFGLIGMLIGALLFVLWVWMIVDCAKRNFRDGNEKIMWLVIIVLGSWVGAIVYYILIALNNPQGVTGQKSKKK